MSRPIPTYSQDEMESDTYIWRTGGKMSVSIFSQTFALKEGGPDKSLSKITQKDNNHRKVDVDADILSKLFKRKFDVEVDLCINRSFNKVRDYLQVLGSKKEYDCFFFIFLTYTQPENTAGFKDERLHFNDATLEKGLVPFEKILDEVKDMTMTRGKPKIFLIQADDVSLIDEKKTYKKHPNLEPESTKTKIPQDSDRLIIKSTIPQRIANAARNGDASTNPSFLIQAFCDALGDNDCDREDLLSLTTVINGKVADMVKGSKHGRAKEMSVPLVTSTLCKIVNLAVKTVSVHPV